MNILLLGPQGSGKGTQAELLVKDYGFHHFEAGKILRSIAQSDNPHAQEIKDTMVKGGLVPDELVRLIAWDYINKHEKNHGFLFDGYPRSVAQYEHLTDMLARFGKKIDLVINITISPAETVRRLSARRTCSKCGEIYNLITNPPTNPTTCDKCGGELVQRSDDQPEAIKKRLEIYQNETFPVLQKAENEGIAITLDGERPIEVIYADIKARLRNAQN